SISTPPSTLKLSPWTKLAASESRIRTAFAISSGWPKRPMGMRPATIARCSGASGACIGVSPGPGLAQVVRRAVPATARREPFVMVVVAPMARRGAGGGRAPSAGLVTVGADRDDSAPAARQHALERGLDREEGALRVHREDAIPLLRGDFEQRQRGDDPGARDEAVDPAELALGQIEDRVDLGKIGDVGAKVADFAGELAGGRLQALSVEVRQQHPRT